MKKIGTFIAVAMVACAVLAMINFLAPNASDISSVETLQSQIEEALRESQGSLKFIEPTEEDCVPPEVLGYFMAENQLILVAPTSLRILPKYSKTHTVQVGEGDFRAPHTLSVLFANSKGGKLALGAAFMAVAMMRFF